MFRDDDCPGHRLKSKKSRFEPVVSLGHLGDLEVPVLVGQRVSDCTLVSWTLNLDQNVGTSPFARCGTDSSRNRPDTEWILDLLNRMFVRAFGEGGEIRRRGSLRQKEWRCQYKQTSDE